MGCGCGEQAPADLWEVVHADQTVSEPMSKPEATALAAGRDGSWIRPVGEPAKV